MSFDDLRRDINAALRSDIPRARRLATKYQRLARKTREPLRTAEALVQLAKVDHVGGRLERAVAGYGRARRLFARAGAKAEAVATDVSAVQAVAILGRAAEARRLVRDLRQARVEPLLRVRAELAIGAALGSLGDESGAERACRNALAALRGNADSIEAANARSNLGVQLARRGAVPEALEELERALAFYDAHGLSAAAEATRHNRGWARGLGGRALEALDDLRAAHEAFSRRGDRRRAALALLDEADLALRLGDAEGAAGDARDAAEALARAKAPLESARALLVAALAERARDRVPAAGSLARRARAAFARARDRAGVALADVALGRRLAAAETTLLAAGHALGALDALVARGRRAGGAALERRLRAYPEPLRRWIVPEALLLRARGTRDPIPLLRRAVRATEELRARAPTAALRAAALSSRLGAYESLARALIARGRASDRREAFRVLDLARARTLREEVGREAPGLGDPPRVRELRRRLEALWGALERRGGEGGDLRGAAPGLWREVGRCERDLLRAGERASARGLGGRAPHAMPRHDCLAYAAIGGEVVGMFASGGDVEAWACGPLAALRADLDAFRFQVTRRLHGGGDADAAGGPLARLAARLLPRVLPGRFAVALPPELGSLPVEALPIDGVPLLERAAIYHVPTAYAPSPAPLPLFPGVLVGIDDEALPEIRLELDEVSALVPSARILRGRDATRGAILQAVDGMRLVHVAGHALAREDRPPLSALRVADGWLAAADFGAADLRGALVVLSACRSGDPSLLWRGEALGGFPRALLAAGAAGVVASRWEIPDATARAFMRLLYERLQTEPAHEAAARAARGLRERFPHPADWAGFLMIAGGSSAKG